MSTTFAEQIAAYGAAARTAYQVALGKDEAARRGALHAVAEALRRKSAEIEETNARDVHAARSAGMNDALCDRLVLNRARINAAASSLTQVASSPSVLDVVSEDWQVVSNGLHISKRTIPIGVIGMIYEARPGVTIDAAGLCIKSGNAVILRGGSECFHTNQLLAEIIREALVASGFDANLVQMVGTTDRAMVDAMLAAHGQLDVLIPRGGQSLTEKVAREARMPTILHLAGNCHTYVHESADLAKSLPVVVNAKMRRTSICGATESLLIDRSIAPAFLPLITDALGALGCELRGCVESRAVDARLIAAEEHDFAAEYLAPVLSVKLVDGVVQAAAHINAYGSHHTDAILADDAKAIEQFTSLVDSAIVMVNASTQFADGGEFGFGGEIGIATGRMPPRGPVAARGLTTYKYIVHGQHAQRP